MYVKASWTAITTPNRYLDGVPALLAQGGESLLLHGLAFKSDLEINCTFHSAEGVELRECSVVAQVVNSFLLRCDTQQCSHLGYATISLPALESSPDLDDSAREIALVASWRSVEYDGAAVELAQGSASVRLLGVFGDSVYNCSFYDGQTLGASRQAVTSGQDLLCGVPQWSLPGASMTVRLFRINTPIQGRGFVTIEFSGQVGGDSLLMQAGIEKIEPTQALAHGGTLLTVYGSALPTSSTLICIFERADAKTLVTRAFSISGLRLLCPAAQWGRWNSAGGAAGLVWLNVSNDARFAGIDSNDDFFITFQEFKTAVVRGVLPHDDLDAAQLARLFEGIDLDSDSRLSLDEFWPWAPRASKSIIAHSNAGLGSLSMQGAVLFETALDDTSNNLLPLSVLPSGGQSLHISGMGFDSKVQYQCAFFESAGATRYALSPATVDNVTHITCNSVQWPWPRSMDARVKVLLDKAALAVDNQTSTGLPMSINDAVLSLQPSSGSARGGSNVTVLGYGFDVQEPYRCLFGGLESSDAWVESPFVLVCTTITWPYASATIPFGLQAAGRMVDRIGLRVTGVLEYRIVSEAVGFVVYAEAIGINPQYFDRLGGTDGGASPAITVTGAGFDSSLTYRCEVHDGERKVQSFVTRPSSPSTVVCEPPQWDLVTLSHDFMAHDTNLTLLSSTQSGWRSGPVFAEEPFALRAVSINKAPMYSVETGDGSGYWVQPTYVNVTEPPQGSSRDFAFAWALNIKAGSTYLSGQASLCLGVSAHVSHVYMRGTRGEYFY